MDGLIMAAQIILSLSILVGLHEMGHLVAAKFFGMRVEQFSIGFPPKLFSFKKGETEYALSAIPLGGYVKISGMIDESLDTEAMKQEPQEWEFRSKPAWQRLIVMLGGIIVNVITGMVIFIFVTWIWGDKFLPKDMINANGGIEALALAQEIGLQTGDKIVKVNGEDFHDFNQIIHPDVLLTPNAYYTVERNGQLMDIPLPGNMIENFSDKKNLPEFISFRIPFTVGEVREGTVADRIGLKAGDVITEVDGKPVQYFDEFSLALRSRTADTITVRWMRGGDQLTVLAPIGSDTVMGFMAKPLEGLYKESAITYSFAESVPLGSKRAFSVVFLQLKAFGRMFSGDISVRKSLAGPIGIAKAYGGNWEWRRFWYMTGLLSMVLAFMNLLPIPALDGGHVMFLSYEMVSGRKPGDKFLENAQKVGMVLLLALMAFIIFNDLIKAIFGI
jgi:regulator of sigma E protease